MYNPAKLRFISCKPELGVKKVNGLIKNEFNSRNLEEYKEENKQLVGVPEGKNPQPLDVPKKLASEMILKKMDRDGYDLDLTRFNTDERVDIKTDYFFKMSTFIRPNHLK